MDRVQLFDTVLFGLLLGFLLWTVLVVVGVLSPVPIPPLPPELFA